MKKIFDECIFFVKHIINFTEYTANVGIQAVKIDFFFFY